MNSCLYSALVMHNRLSPKQHKFHYKVFMFYIDLDEIDQLKKFTLISHNKFNFFNFKDKEHLRLPMDKPDDSKTTKEHIINYLSQNGVAVSYTHLDVYKRQSLFMADRGKKAIVSNYPS